MNFFFQRKNALRLVVDIFWRFRYIGKYSSRVQVRFEWFDLFKRSFFCAVDTVVGFEIKKKKNCFSLLKKDLGVNERNEFFDIKKVYKFYHSLF